MYDVNHMMAVGVGYQAQIPTQCHPVLFNNQRCALSTVSSLEVKSSMVYEIGPSYITHSERVDLSCVKVTVYHAVTYISLLTPGIIKIALRNGFSWARRPTKQRITCRKLSLCLNNLFFLRNGCFEEELYQVTAICSSIPDMPASSPIPSAALFLSFASKIETKNASILLNSPLFQAAGSPFF